MTSAGAAQLKNRASKSVGKYGARVVFHRSS
jgi:hypothetical protein